MSHRTCYVLFNPASGTASATGLTADTLAQRLAERGVDAEVASTARDGSFPELLARARESSAEVLVAAGGDGTVTAMADAAVKTGKQLAILPLGTANLLARDLDIPIDLNAWIDAFATMEPRRIDVATVNERLYLHKVVIGLLPGIASARERLRTHTGPLSTLAFLGFIKRRIERLRRIRLTMKVDDHAAKRESVSAIAVANNAYSEGFGRVFSRETLDAGKLTVYIARRITVVDVLRLFGGMLVGNWYRAHSFETVHAETLVLDRNKRIVKAMIDGDPATLENPLRFSIHPGALSVLTPPPAADTGLTGVLDLLQPG